MPQYTGTGDYSHMSLENLTANVSLHPPPSLFPSGHTSPAVMTPAVEASNGSRSASRAPTPLGRSEADPMASSSQSDLPYACPGCNGSTESLILPSIKTSTTSLTLPSMCGSSLYGRNRTGSTASITSQPNASQTSLKLQLPSAATSTSSIRSPMPVLPAPTSALPSWAERRTSSSPIQPRRVSDADRTNPNANRRETFESCMESGIAHESKSCSAGHAGEAAQRHLVLAASMFAAALAHKPGSSWATLRRATVLLHLANLSPPPTAIAYLRESRNLLAPLAASAPHSTSAREALATVCTRLSALLHAGDDEADDATEVWEGEVGRFACEALAALEEVAAERMDRARALRRDAFEDEAPGLADMFLSLAEAAGVVSTLAIDGDVVDMHAELAEHALDQAANMATLAANSGTRSPNASTALITRVQLASGRAATERLRHMFLLGVSLDEEDFAALLSDMADLVAETRDRASKLKGSRAAQANAQAYEAMRQFGDSKLQYAYILRLVWRECAIMAMPSTPHLLQLPRLSELPPPSPWEGIESAGLASVPEGNDTTPVPARTRSGSTPALAHSRNTSVSSSVGSLESPTDSHHDTNDTDRVTKRRSASSLPAMSPLTTVPETGVAFPLDGAVLSTQPPSTPHKRAPPPPPLKLVRPPPSGPLPPLPQLSPHTPLPLSPLNPSAASAASTPGLARRASELANPARPRLARASPTAAHTHQCRASWLPNNVYPFESASMPTTPSAATGTTGSAPISTVHTPRTPGFTSMGRLQRRLSAMTSPLSAAWDRKPTVASDEPELQASAWSLLTAAQAHYKTALTLLSGAAYSPTQRAQRKSHILFQVAAASVFRATLLPSLRRRRSSGSEFVRLGLTGSSNGMAGPGPDESATALLSTAEVYAAWAAREVGWSFLIEGTAGAERADRRTGSWEADEAGKRAVLLMLRVWWLRATAELDEVPSQLSKYSDASGETKDANAADKTMAREKVETVVKRLRDLEGVGHGDVARFTAWLVYEQGELLPEEVMFWRSVRRILRGGDGGVM